MKNYKLQITNYKFLNNWKLEIGNWKFQSGFTLVELLVVLTLLSVIGTITAQVFVLGTRSLGKSEILKEVKQNGDYVEQVVESMIRNAVDISKAACNRNTDILTITNTDGYTTSFDCSDTIQISSTSGLTSLSLNSSRVRVSNCNFRVICPTPPIYPPYVFFTFSICQASGIVCPAGTEPESRAAIDYQTTVALRNYQ